MTTPVQLTGRNRRNVMTGAPDVRYSGGFFIGKPAQDATKFPKNAAEEASEIVERLGLESGGYITSDGVSESEDRSTEKILDWNLDVIDIVETEYSLQLTVTFAEAANAAVLKFLYGEENVEVTDTGVYIKKKSREMPSSAIMFDIKGKNGAKGRAYGDECQVASIGEVAYNKQGLIQYEATIDVMNDVTGTYLHTWLDHRVEAGGGEETDPENP